MPLSQGLFYSTITLHDLVPEQFDIMVLLNLRKGEATSFVVPEEAQYADLQSSYQEE